jgi:hypothetical protein
VVTGPPAPPPPPQPPTRTPVQRQNVAKSQGWFFLLHHIQDGIKVYINETMHAKCTHVTQVLNLYVV